MLCYVLAVTEFVLSYLMAFLYRYAIVPAFISIKEEDYKFLLATAAPAFMVIPALICRPFGEVPKLCTLAEALS